MSHKLACPQRQGEFDIISQYFADLLPDNPDVLLGIGDDAALLASPPNGQALAVTTDTLVSGVHFPDSTSAHAIGYKALAVNLSDLAAMGAKPAWFTLALTLPAHNDIWLRDFAAGIAELARAHQLSLVGGDLTRGPVCVITIQVHGYVPVDKALSRSQAKPGDAVYVSGNLGDAGLALAGLEQKISLSQQSLATLQSALDYPQPRVELGQLLRDYASSVIDISDGLAQDLRHVLQASRCGAVINVDDLPHSKELQSAPISDNEKRDLMLNAGDDYELCFTIPKKKTAEFETALKFHRPKCVCTCIGMVESESGLRLQLASGQFYALQRTGYDHFH